MIYIGDDLTNLIQGRLIHRTLVPIYFRARYSEFCSIDTLIFLNLVQIKEFSNYRNVIAEFCWKSYALVILLLFWLLKRVDGQNTISRKH